MPNIIEQQDLLKGLPDDRLAMMMQAPTGDIPPFLVAAEAQRRQSIREQFSGGPQESVVDSLVKQFANVPQNLQSADQQQMPQQMPPQMGGVAALQGQQQMQQMPQGVPQQAMRRGGYVQRYNDGSLVQPSLYNPQAASSPSEQMAQTYMLLNPGMTYEEALQRAGIGQPLARPTVGELAAAQANKVGMSGVGNYSVLRRPSEMPESESAVDESAAGVTAQPQRSATPAGASMGMSFVGGVPTANPSVPPNPEAGKEPTSADNKLKGMSRAEVEKAFRDMYGTSSEDTEYMRQKLKELYEYESSSWEKAQKWFQASQAAIQPGQNNWQATINALAALGGGMAEERAGQRASERDLAEAMLKLEMSDRAERRQSEQNIAKGLFDWQVDKEEREIASATAARDERLDALKWQAERETENAKAYGQRADQLSEALNRRVSDLMRSGVVGEEDLAKDPTIADLTKKIADLNLLSSNAMLRAREKQSAFGSATGAGTRVRYADGNSMGFLD